MREPRKRNTDCIFGFCCQVGKFYKRTCDVWFLHIEKFGIKKWRDDAFQCSEHATKTKRDQHHEE